MIQLSPSFLAEKLDLELSTIIKATSDAVGLMTIDGRLEWSNQGFEALFGYSFSEVAGRRPMSFLGSERNSDALLEEISAKMSAQESFLGELYLKNKQGKLLWVSLSLNPVFDAAGYFEHYAWVARDLSAYLDLQKKNEELKDIVKALITQDIVS